MNLHLIDLRTCPARPWRNGGGLTRELLAWPDAGAWQLRVSVARIERDGLFSPFEGMQRWFAVLFGRGVCLSLPQGEVHVLPGDDALPFDGELAPMCRLLGGPTEDLNLMAARDAGRSRMWRATPGSRIDDATRWRGLFAGGPLLFEVGDHAQPLAAGTLAWSDAHEADPWLLRQGSQGWWLTLEDG